MPTNLGYQPNYGIGNVQYSSTPGSENIEPEAKAIRSNIVPSAINKGMKYGSFVSDALRNTIPTLTRSSEKALGNYLMNSFNEAVSTANVKAGIDGTITSTAPQLTYKTALNTAGKAAAAIGAAYGLTDMGFQIANNKDHRSAGQMRNTLSTNTYTTDLGNTYTTLGGVNRNAELNYARAQRLNKNLDFTTTAIGTGATIGSFWPGAGTAIGAGVGALVGLGANLLGFGDTEEETNKQMDLLTDAVSMENRMSESQALDKDAKQGFYGRTRSGSLSAANGKLPGYTRGKGVARLSGGEVVQLGGLKVEVPGKKNNKDEYVARKGTLLGEMISDPRSVVWTNKGGISDYIKNGGNESVALEAMNNMQMKYKNGKGYKCGKLPKFEGGYWDKALMAIPNIAQILAATQQYNKDRKMPVEAPRRMADYSSARNQAYALLNNRIDPRPYMRIIDEDTARNKYAITRMPGMGMGGRAVMMDAIGAAGLNAKMKQLLSINEREYEKEKFARNLMATINTHEQDVENQNFADYAHRYAQASGMKYNNLAQDLKNMVTPFGQIIGDWWKYDQYQDAKGLNKDKIGIFQQTANTDKIRALADLYGRTPISGYGAYGTGDWAEENYKLGQAAKRAYNTMNF